METVDYKNVSFTVWDVGGQNIIRTLWRHYFTNTQVLLTVSHSLKLLQIYYFQNNTILVPNNTMQNTGTSNTTATWNANGLLLQPLQIQHSKYYKNTSTTTNNTIQYTGTTHSTTTRNTNTVLLKPLQVPGIYRTYLQLLLLLLLHNCGYVC